MTLRNGIAIAAALSAALVFGCSKDTSGGGAAGSGSAAAGGGTGVKECDDWIAKMQACQSKMDPSKKDEFAAGFEATKTGFVQTAATPDGKTTLKANCTQLLSAFDRSHPECK